MARCGRHWGVRPQYARTRRRSLVLGDRIPVEAAVDPRRLLELHLALEGRFPRSRNPFSISPVLPFIVFSPSAHPPGGSVFFTGKPYIDNTPLCRHLPFCTSFCIFFTKKPMWASFSFFFLLRLWRALPERQHLVVPARSFPSRAQSRAAPACAGARRKQGACVTRRGSAARQLLQRSPQLNRHAKLATVERSLPTRRAVSSCVKPESPSSS